MVKKKAFLAAMAAIIGGLLVLSACSQPAVAGKGAIKATWINATVSGDTVSVPASEVKKDSIIHFRVRNPAGEMTFMSYEYEGQLQVRADICPPCRSQSFSLVGSTLVCDACGTVFDARTGAGIRGACVAYPKASVAYQNSNGALVMQGADPCE